MKLEEYRDMIPIGAENAASYNELKACWGCSKRQVRAILHRLAITPTADGYIIIRTSHGSGFYRTNELKQIRAYRKEIINRAMNTYKPVEVIDDFLYSQIKDE